jgi:hypothetical protein
VKDRAKQSSSESYRRQPQLPLAPLRHRLVVKRERQCSFQPTAPHLFYISPAHLPAGLTCPALAPTLLPAGSLVPHRRWRSSPPASPVLHRRRPPPPPARHPVLPSTVRRRPNSAMGNDLNPKDWPALAPAVVPANFTNNSFISSPKFRDQFPKIP